MAITVADVLGGELVKLLGMPKYTRWFRMDFILGDLVKITCVFYPSLTQNEEGELLTAIKRYKLVEIEEEGADGEEG